MTFENLKSDFFATEKSSYMYHENDRVVRLFKNRLAERVEVVYSASDYSGRDPKYGLQDDSKAEIIGFVVNGEFVPTTYLGCHFSSLAASVNSEYLSFDRLRYEAEGLVESKVKELLEEMTPPEITDEWEQSRCREAGWKMLLYGEDDAEHFNLCHESFTTDWVVDFLNETEGWAEEAAKKWLGEKGDRAERVLQQKAREALTAKYFYEAMDDPNCDIRVRKDMMDAIKSTKAKTVEIQFETVTGGVDSTKIDVEAFDCQCVQEPWQISLWKISPSSEKVRVGKCCVGSEDSVARGSYTSYMPISSIVSIRYKGKAIWKSITTR